MDISNIDASDMKTVQEAFKAAGHGLDFFKRLVPKINPPWRKAADDAPADTTNDAAGIAEAFYGKPTQASEFNAKLRHYLDTRTQPFIIRIGEQISIPGSDAIATIARGIQGRAVWDWHYVFNYPNMSSVDKNHLRENFLDERGQILNDISTSSLMMSRSRLPDHFQKGVFIFGLEATNLSYEDLHVIETEKLIPMHVLLCLKEADAKFSVISDPVAARYWLNEVCEFVESIAGLGSSDGFEASLFCSGELDENGLPRHKERGLVPIANALK